MNSRTKESMILESLNEKSFDPSNWMYSVGIDNYASIDDAFKHLLRTNNYSGVRVNRSTGSLEYKGYRFYPNLKVNNNDPRKSKFLGDWKFSKL